jgi:hypothetical protein
LLIYLPSLMQYAPASRIEEEEVPCKWRKSFNQ